MVSQLSISYKIESVLSVGRSACRPAQSEQSLQGNLWVAKDPKCCQADSEGSDQPVRRTCSFVGNVPRVNCFVFDASLTG